MDQEGSLGARGRDRRDAHDSAISPRELGRNRTCDNRFWEPVRNLKRPRATCEISRQPFDKGRNAKGGARPFRRQGGCGYHFAWRDGARDRGNITARRRRSCWSRATSTRPRACFGFRPRLAGTTSRSMAKQPDIGKLIDTAMDLIEADNPSLRGVLRRPTRARMRRRRERGEHDGVVRNASRFRERGADGSVLDGGGVNQPSCCPQAR